MILSAIKTAIAPYRLYLEAAVAVIAVMAFLWYRHSLIEQGVQQQQDADAKVAAAQIIHNTEVESRAKTLAEMQLAALKTTLAAPPSSDAPHLSCVSSRPRSRAVPKDAGPSTGTNPATEQPAVVEAVSEGTWDIGPDVDKRFRDDDALISALQARIELEVGVCR